MHTTYSKLIMIGAGKNTKLGREKKKTSCRGKEKGCNFRKDTQGKISLKW